MTHCPGSLGPNFIVTIVQGLENPGFHLWPPRIQYLQRDQSVAPDEADLPIITSKKLLQSTCGSSIRQQIKEGREFLFMFEEPYELDSQIAFRPTGRGQQRGSSMAVVIQIISIDNDFSRLILFLILLPSTSELLQQLIIAQKRIQIFSSNIIQETVGQWAAVNLRSNTLCSIVIHKSA